MLAFGRTLIYVVKIGGPILKVGPTSYDVFPHKEVPFGGRDDAAPHLGGQIPQEPQSWRRK